MSKVLTVVDSDFKRQVLDSPDPVLVSFRASWCQPSQLLAPVIDDMANRFGDRMRFVAVNEEDKSKGIRKRTRVTRLPVTMMFDGGQSVDFIGGLASRGTIVDMIKKRLQPVIEVNEFNFDADVLRSRLPVLAHFHAVWCRQSLGLIPVIDRIAQEYRGRLKTVRIEFGPDTTQLCARLQVSRVPTLSLFVNGQIRDQIFGGLAGAAKVRGVRGSGVGPDSFEKIEQLVAPALK